MREQDNELRRQRRAKQLRKTLALEESPGFLNKRERDFVESVKLLLEAGTDISWPQEKYLISLYRKVESAIG